MHLWQIRHNPNRHQTLLKLTFVTASLFIAAITLFCEIGYVAGQTGESGASKPGVDTKPSPAAEFLERVRQELPKHRSIKADLAQSVSIGEQQFKVEGQYFSSVATTVGNHEVNKLRLSYKITPDQGVEGKMLEICDGKDLWTELTLPDPKNNLPDSKRVTRRNVQQILAASLNQKNVPESTMTVELGLGGLAALLASLDRTMAFEAMKEETSDGHAITIIQGRWKKGMYPNEKENSLPPFVPDLVRIYVNNQTLFPEKLLYLKKQPQKKTFKSLVSLEFTNVEFDGPVDEDAFVYILPPEIDPVDITKQYLDRLTAPAANGPASK